MAAAVAVEAQPVERLAPWQTVCPSCAGAVLLIELADGRDVVLEVPEVLELHRCPRCASKAGRGHLSHGCMRCDDRGWLGEPLPAVGGVRVDAEGVGCVYRGWRDAGDAVHRRHVCGAAGGPTGAERAPAAG